MKTNRRRFLQAATVASVGYFVSAGVAQEESKSPNEKLGVACIGIGGKGGGDANHAAMFGNIVAICDVDKKRLEGKGNANGFTQAKRYVDFREMLTKHEKEIDIVTVSTPDHMHTAQTLMAMRMGKHVYTQKPLTRTIYEARLLAKVAKDNKVCTQMGNQGTALNESRNVIAQLRGGLIGKMKEVYIWSNRPVWPQNPFDPTRTLTIEDYIKYAKANSPSAEKAEEMINAKKAAIAQGLEVLDWKLWLGTAKYREYMPGLYHTFNWRGWWDFGSGALGDMACHHVTIPFAACDLKDPTWVRAKTSGHDFNMFPASSVIDFEFPANENRGVLPFHWYDRHGNQPPREIFEKYKINPSGSGSLIIGENGALFTTDDYGRNNKFLKEGGEEIKDRLDVEVTYAEDKGGFDVNQMYELFRAVKANDPKIAVSNFVDRAGPMTETILLGNLAVWAASKGGETAGEIGEWGEKIEWDAKNLKVTNLKDLKTPGVEGLIKPVYTEGYVLDTLGIRPPIHTFN
ncbi:MAG: Gfo/Idh/MocA family oxidoreductase [Planctomycetaceae bacterium]|jgi:predicted dehydrogenase|nr:Gfo/Idh/MocA family oxidoreductase [Planctomycetaceae bacterium]